MLNNIRNFAKEKDLREKDLLKVSLMKVFNLRIDKVTNTQNHVNSCVAAIISN